MAPRLRWGASCVLAFVFVSSTAQAQHVPPAAYQWAARIAGIPPSVLFAVALQESGTPLHGRVIPWPWTLNIAGTPSRYANRAQACSVLERALKQVPATRVDVGLGQVNVGYHGYRVKRPCELLEPQQNLATAATILSEQHEAGDDWLVAVGRYHRPAGGEPAARYRRSVRQHLLTVLGTRDAPIPSEVPPHELNR